MARAKIKKVNYKFRKDLDTGPQEYQYMSDLQANMIHSDRVKKQVEARKKLEKEK